MAIGAVKLQLVTSGRWTVTAEVASSSLVVPAILSKGVIGRDTENSNPQPNPQSLIYRGAYPYRIQEFALRSPCRVAIILRAKKIKGFLNFCVTRDSLNAFRFDFRVIHQPVAQAVTQVVKSKPLAVRHLYSGFSCRRSQMVGEESA